jgi:hypothetical protein
MKGFPLISNWVLKVYIKFKEIFEVREESDTKAVVVQVKYRTEPWTKITPTKTGTMHIDYHFISDKIVIKITARICFQ